MMKIEDMAMKTSKQKKQLDIITNLSKYMKQSKLPQKTVSLMISPDYNPILGSLYSRLLEFSDNMVRKLKDTDTYKDNREILNEIELLPVAYLYYRYPFFDQLQRYYLPTSPDPDNYDDNVSFSEDMEEWQDQADQFEKAFPEGLASASAFHSNLEKVRLEDVEDYIQSYAMCKKFDLDYVSWVMNEYKDSDKDFSWLAKVKEKCNEPIEREAFYNPFVLPIYLRYRNNWLFDYIKGYANNRNNEYLGRANEIIKKDDELQKRNNALIVENQRLLLENNEAKLKQLYKYYDDMLQLGDFDQSKVTLIVIPDKPTKLEESIVDQGEIQAKSIRIKYDGIKETDEKDLNCFTNKKGRYLNKEERILLLQLAFYGKNKAKNKTKIDALLEKSEPYVISHLNTMFKALFNLKRSNCFIDKKNKDIKVNIQTSNVVDG
jgi:hypothetical protein